jgi:Ca2+-binding RTX toxin-like protein
MILAADYQFNAEYDTPIALDQNAVDQGFSIMNGLVEQGEDQTGEIWRIFEEKRSGMSTLEQGSFVLGVVQAAMNRVVPNTPLGAPVAIVTMGTKISVLSEAISQGNVKPSDILGVVSGAFSLISAFAILAQLGIAGTAAAAGAAYVAAVFGAAAIALTVIGYLLDTYQNEISDFLGDAWQAFSDFMTVGLDSVVDALSSISNAIAHGTDNLIDQLSDMLDQARAEVSPLILDLDSDGIETLGINSGVHFDHDGNGFSETTGWVGRDDGLLVWDRNGNSRIDDGSELFGNYSLLANGERAANGFAALADLDSNHDGNIDASDAAFNNLHVWRDGNSDAKVDVGELLSLTEANIGSLNIAFTSQNQVDAQGNQVLQVGQYTGADGIVHSMNDVWFNVDTARTFDLIRLAISDEIATLPDMAGFGNVSDLRQTMARDVSGFLQILVEQFAGETDATVRQTLLDQIIFAWSGAAKYGATSRGGYIDDGRKIYAVEAFLGQGFIQSAGINEGTGNPGPNAAAKLMQAYNRLAGFVYSGLMLQTHFKSLIEMIEFNPIDNKLVLSVGRVVGQLQAMYSENSAFGTQVMEEFSRSLLDAGAFGSSILICLRQAGDVNVPGFSYLLANLGYLLGGFNDDELYGDDHDNILFGLAGQDTLYGGVGDDVFEGGEGNDYLSGDSGSDIYRFNRGWGQDILNNFDYGSDNGDFVEFGVGIAPAEIVATRSGDNLILTLSGGADRVKVVNYFYNDGLSDYHLEGVRFADGTIWELEQIKVMVATSTAGDDEIHGYASSDNLNGGLGNDSLYGGQGVDTINGGYGNDYLEGGTGSDVYYFNLGDGQDVINENSESLGDIDVLHFGEGIDPDDINVSIQGASLILRHGNGEDKVIFLNWFDQVDSRYQVERIEFADGTVWRSTELTSGLLNRTGTEGDDVITGANSKVNHIFSGGGGNDNLTTGAGNDQLEGGADNDTLNGGAGSDTYLFNLGDGQDLINDNSNYGGGTDVLKFGAGILASDITVSRAGNNLALDHSNGQDRITVNNWFTSTGDFYQLERIEFADGTVWTSAALSAQLLQLTGGAGNDVLTGISAAFKQVLSGGGGNDTLTAGSGDDQLEGGTGNDTLNGGAGSDTYLFNLGDGQDVINDDNISYYYGGVDVLRFGTGIQAADISASRSGTSLVLSHVNGQDQVTVTNWFTENTGHYQLERIEFYDGTVWTSAALSAQLLQLTGGAGDDVLTGVSSNQPQVIRGGGGNDTLTAGSGDDQLEGGTGNDTLNGGAGSDTYLFNLGDGRDVINDDNISYYYGGVDVLRFGPGIQAADISASRSGTSLVLSHVNGQDQVTVTNWFTENTGHYQLERIEFSDGTVWTSAALSAQLLQLTGGAGNEVLTGISAAFKQVLSGGGGNDILTAGTGDDQLEGGTGNDTLNGGAGSDTYLFSLGDGRDVINDDNISYYYGGVDVLRFGPGIQAADISASRSGTSLVLSHRNGQDQVTVTNWFTENTGHYQLERIEFSDGTVWTSAALSAQLLQITGGTGDDVLTGISSNQSQVIRGGGGNDTLTAGSGDDLLEGGTGNDVLNGGQGSDLYLFNLGDGQDVINDDNISYYYGGVDVLRFGTGIQAADISASRSGTSLVLSHVNGQDQVTVTNWFTENTGRYQLERIEFADGTVWTSTALSAQLLQLTGGAGNDVLTGISAAFKQVLSGGGGSDTLTAGSGDDQLEGGTGNDTLSGGAGSDTYLFNLGDGQDVINDDNISYYYGGVDVLRFGTGIQAADISASRSGTSLVLSHVNGQDQVTVTNWFTENSGRYQLERIEFADGAFWNSSQVTSRASTSGNDTIVGSSTNDRLQGAKGNDLLQGGEGSDTYLFATGDGQDIINNFSTTPNDIDVLSIDGITPQNLWLSRDNNNLVIDAREAEDRIVIKDWYVNPTQQIDVIQAGSTALYANAVDNLVNAMAAFGAPAGGEINLTQDQRDQVNVVIATNWQ